MFCIVKGYEKLGLAKIIDISNDNVEVEYFNSPIEKKRLVKKVHSTKIFYKKLGTNTRIYYQKSFNTQWLVGRVKEDNGNDGIYVRFADKNDLFISYDKLYVRCKKKIVDSVDYLATIITETPQYAETRSSFVANYIAQRRGTWGISALLSSVIELESHQINVIRRVLNDPCQRYLLADEVGLGKTIEAGVIIRQAILDDLKNHFVVILVPKSLVQQWRQELTEKFGLKDFLDISIYIFSYESIKDIKDNLKKATLLVIDEAHHVASTIDDNSHVLYGLVSAYAPKIERVLLLSATPVLRNEVGFLRMLHLLDPVVYKLDDIDSFRMKIKHRQTLAEIVAALNPENALFLHSFLNDLVKILPNDIRLVDLVNNLLSYLDELPDEEDAILIESIRILRVHLSETYRLHRRILRNRRKKVTGLTPIRKGVKLLSNRSGQINRLEAIIEEWRVTATLANIENQGQLVNFFWEIISALLTNPIEIKSLCTKRIKNIRNNEITFEGEDLLLGNIVNILNCQDWLKERIETLREMLPELLTDSVKIVIFCSNEIIADAVFEDLEHNFHKNVVRHEISEDEEFETPLWLNFNTDNKIKIIVCDYKAEEGINLQGGEKLVIHFDMPIEPNRIEQRMGRVDRYCAGEDILSVVMIEEESIYQREWFQFLNGALKIFDRSISSLQYLIDEKIQDLKETLFIEGVDALKALCSEMSGENGYIAVELKLIDQQDSLDELAVLDENDLDSIFDIDSEWLVIRQVTLDWACKTLLFEEVNSEHQFNQYEKAFRFRYSVPGHGGVVTLIPIYGFMSDFLGSLDYEYKHSTARQPLSYPHLSRRQGAIKSGTRLIRYGDDFIEALNQFSDFDDRGRSYAIWRHIYNDSVSVKGIYFRFDFLIETEIEYAKNILKLAEITQTETAISAITRRGDALYPPRVVQIWVDEDGNQMSEDFIEKYLNSSYDKNGNHDYKDTNLKSLRFIELMQKYPNMFANWYEHCFKMKNKAISILIKGHDYEQDKLRVIKNARIDDEIRFAQLETRIRLLEGDEKKSESDQLYIEKKINEALYEGIKKPSIRVDVAGLVILSNSGFVGR
jgi:ATP-dependent helicase HepA